MTVVAPSYLSFDEKACSPEPCPDSLTNKKTSQGYARKRTLKPGGSSVFGGAF